MGHNGNVASQLNSKKSVAAYMRMSTEHQKYSIKNQMDAIQSYAELNNMEIVATFSDRGKSGLTIKGRAGLSSLLAIVNSGEAPFSDILVFDVSRWGRFQDSDEGAYYEYQCKLNNIKVTYCAEIFDNDGSPLAAIIKSLKRAMAGEYSRELSAKVHRGQCTLTKLGFRQGGSPGYGLRRMLIDQYGNKKQILETGQHKCIHTDRVKLVPGPQHEIDIIFRIYNLYIKEKLSVNSIVKILNDECIKTERDTKWTYASIITILKNEKYIGTNIYNKTSLKLKGGFRKNSPEKWISVEGCYEPVVPQHMHRAVKRIFKKKTVFKTNERMILDLKRLLKRHGYLSRKLIDNAKGVYGITTYISRFGSIAQAIQLAGYDKKKISTCEMIEALMTVGKEQGKLTSTLLRNDKRLPEYTLTKQVFGSVENAYLMAGYTNSKFTNNEIIKLMKIQLKKHGRLTSTLIASDRSLPQKGVIITRFGSIAELYNKIGYKKNSLSDSEMIDCLKTLLNKHGKLTTSLINQEPQIPSSFEYDKRFGKCSNAYRLAGYTPPRKSDEEMLDGLRRLLKEKGTINKKLIDKTSWLAHSDTYRVHFGSIHNAFKKIKYNKKIPRKVLLEGLQRIFSKHGKITNKLIDAEPEIPSRGYYEKEFGSLLKAYSLVGFKGHNMSKKELLSKLKKLLKEKGRLTKEIINECPYTPSSKAYTGNFGNIKNAYSLVGYLK